MTAVHAPRRWPRTPRWVRGHPRAHQWRRDRTSGRDAGAAVRSRAPRAPTFPAAPVPASSCASAARVIGKLRYHVRPQLATVDQRREVREVLRPRLGHHRGVLRLVSVMCSVQPRSARSCLGVLGPEWKKGMETVSASPVEGGGLRLHRGPEGFSAFGWPGMRLLVVASGAAVHVGGLGVGRGAAVCAGQGRSGTGSGAAVTGAAAGRAWRGQRSPGSPRDGRARRGATGCGERAGRA